MSPMDIIRAWKVETYRLSLTPEQRKALPAHPAGMIELAEAELEAVAGGVVAKSAAKSGCGGGTWGGQGTGNRCTKECKCKKKPPTKKFF